MKGLRFFFFSYIVSYVLKQQLSVSDFVLLGGGGGGGEARGQSLVSIMRTVSARGIHASQGFFLKQASIVHSFSYRLGY